MLLVKLRTGLSHRVLATLFGVYKSTVTYACRIAKISLMTAFVPGNVGFEAVTRDSVINDHTTTLARHLFANGERDKAILIADGTYIEVEKPGNHQLQVCTNEKHLWPCCVQLDQLIETLQSSLSPTINYHQVFTELCALKRTKTCIKTFVVVIPNGGLAGLFLHCFHIIYPFIFRTFALQKDTYSGQKKYNLVKPMCIVASDGHIVAVPGPFLGRNNDATMTKHIAKMPQQNGGDQPDQGQGQAPHGQQQQGEQEGLGGFQSE